MSSRAADTLAASEGGDALLGHVKAVLDALAHVHRLCFPHTLLNPAVARFGSGGETQPASVLIPNAAEQFATLSCRERLIWKVKVCSFLATAGLWICLVLSGKLRQLPFPS